MPLTITEALAAIKTTTKRIEKKREFVKGFLWRQEALKDPLDRDGGSFEAIKRERQAIFDLETHIVHLRRSIQTANDTTSVTINGDSFSISEWLTWRRDIAPKHKEFLAQVRSMLQNARNQATQKGIAMVPAGEAATKPSDIIVNINESDLAKEIEALEDTLGQLDGQLSLKNATVLVSVGEPPAA